MKCFTRSFHVMELDKGYSIISGWFPFSMPNLCFFELTVLTEPLILLEYKRESLPC